MLVWADQRARDEVRDAMRLTYKLRVRDVRVIRDYGMFDRREAPQYHPPALDRR
jgi:hypothetical protein